MNAVVNINENEITDVISRQSSAAKDANVFTDIYREDTSIVVWQRDVSNELNTAINHFLKNHSKKTAILAVTPESTSKVLCDTFGESNMMTALSDDITLLVDMFCCLFDLECAGLRLTVLDRAMCPRFHVDRIPCRLVTTYQGIATEWLNHNVIDRSKLGAGNEGKSDEESGLFKSVEDINRLSEGDVALLKGENWDDTQGAGLVHRSPAVTTGECRLLLTLDFISD
ncbi:DUF1826 domain-containing protein [Pseudocolwellia sp. AS88]|uniref:DUF1826 domain-containing protein n=1 Tax=Pseudocolwellia sp. AS88 TaxID=3063958 RepID=UPI0026EF4DEE|nr:DUF1826 domain-containing protein [Pseudocolwellia sp. AS88]MDO7085710.1 DUF1826 domain-containing protein [Pseudocolwellia sp. AS88]